MTTRPNYDFELTEISITIVYSQKPCI